MGTSANSEIILPHLTRYVGGHLFCACAPGLSVVAIAQRYVVFVNAYVRSVPCVTQIVR